MSDIDYTEPYRQAELETIAQKTEDILADPDGYECSACCIEGQPCDVGLAVKVERERIIKLLESDEWHHIAFATRSPDEQPTKYHDGECLGCRQIVLIKGEQK